MRSVSRCPRSAGRTGRRNGSLNGGPVAVDDAGEVGTRRESAEGMAPVALQPRGAERLRDRLVAKADEEGSLQGERHPLDQGPRARLQRRRIGLEVVAQLGGEPIEPRL